MNAPFVRFSRDRRGYEHFYILQAVPGRGGRVRQRVLYWFRTPPQVKVGREPFDAATRQALESQNPDVRFDWEKIRNTPIPPLQPEHWRERRLPERAARRPSADDESEGVKEGGGQPSGDVPAAGASASAEESRRSRRRRRRRARPGLGPRGEVGAVGSTVPATSASSTSIVTQKDATSAGPDQRPDEPAGEATFEK